MRTTSRLLMSAALIFGMVPAAHAVMATGGTVVETNGYRIHSFTTVGTTSLTITVAGEVEVLVVAGGGGGAGVAAAGGGRGGGGAGGVISTSLVVTTGAKVLFVGAGGNGGTAANSNGVNGANSFFDTITATGGGGGGASGNAGRPGGSGGGGPNGSTGGTGIAGQGYKGGDSGLSLGGGGGGGGASCVGSNAVVTNLGGKGGDGIVSSISGTAIYYGGGGGGGAYQNAPIASGGNGGGGNGGSDSNAAGNATANTGGGGGGSGSKTGGTAHAGGDGGSGIVIVRYASWPSVDNAGGATNITGSSADLNGSLLATGVAPTTVFCCWGASDGGTNTWANTNVWNAPQTPGAFSQHATGLDSNTTYYYRYAASNDSGIAWASSSTVFITGDVWIDTLADASEIGLRPGMFTVHRVSTATNGTLAVNYTVGGTASNGVDYAALSGSISIPDGTSTVALVVAPYLDRLYAEGTETVQVTLVTGPYLIGAMSNASLGIANLDMVTNVWGGGGANTLASNPTNWVGHAIPVAGDVVALDATTNRNMTWDLNIPVQSWIQVGYVGTVTVATVYGPTGFTNFNIIGNCVISNGVWTQNGNTSIESNRLRATIGGDLIVGTNAAIDVTGKGFAAGNGPGAAWGGSYGGLGYNGVLCYGSLVAPTNLGSGGLGGGGGGAIYLNVGGVISNGGNIVSKSLGDPNNYTGSGGSINIVAGAMIGNGTISAAATAGGWGGAGGRVALAVTNAGADFSLYTGTIQAGSASTDTGTIYLRTAGQGLYEGTLLVDNNNRSGTALDISASVTDTAVGNVLLRRGGYLRIRSNQVLRVSGVWSNSATFVSQWGSQVVFTGDTASTSIVYGANTFMGLLCTNAGKTLLFQAGKTNKVAALGQLTLTGNVGTNLTLRSTTNNSAWKLNVDVTAAQTIQYVDVKDSDAMVGVGNEVVAMNSVDSGSNRNWRFVAFGSGETNTWLGTSNTFWASSANWSLARAPVDSDYIIIPSSKPRYPVLEAARTVGGLQIQSGASLTLAGYNLTVTADATVAGAITAAATEILNFQGNVDLTGGSFTAARSTVALASSGVQSFNPANQTFFKVLVLNSADTVAFENGFTAKELRCEAASGTRSLQFMQGATVTLRDLFLLGAVGSTNITIFSSSPGVPWNLAVFGYRSVRGVDVQDSNASFGLPIPASSSQDSGGNVNWTFDVSPSVWLGVSNNNFHTAANWSPAGVPGATTRVLVNSANPMTVTGAVTVLDLMVGGGSAMATGIVNAALNVAETITVLSNGTLILNRPCVVTNSLNVLAGGNMTHDANSSTEVNKLNITVYGNAGVDENGRIDVQSKGYGAGKGPGFGNCGSYGGRAGFGSGPCYGSIVAPTNFGSGGGSLSGAGAVILRVTGTFRNDGFIGADAVNVNWSGAAGSIFVTAGRIVGNGVIEAGTGSVTWNGGGSGGWSSPGGGRISLVVTNTGADFSEFTGTLSANGAGGAGTIYQQRASDRPNCGTVLLDNRGLAGITAMPPSTNYVPGEVDRAVFSVTNAAVLTLVRDFSVADLGLLSANAQLDLNFMNLTIHSKQHAFAGTVANYGSIIWMPDVAGTVFSIR